MINIQHVRNVKKENIVMNFPSVEKRRNIRVMLELIRSRAVRPRSADQSTHTVFDR